MAAPSDIWVGGKIVKINFKRPLEQGFLSLFYSFILFRWRRPHVLEMAFVFPPLELAHVTLRAFYCLRS
jgi:hypothetical protein